MKFEWGVGTGWSRFRIGTGGGFHKNVGNFLTSCKDWLASQEGFCSME
jgi:hypothetical protein